MKLLFALPLLVFLGGCISAVPQANTTASAAQISACQKLENEHNIFLVTALGLGAATSGLGSGEALTTSNGVKIGLAGGTIGTGVLAVVATAVMGIDSQEYIQSGCADILGPLPTSTETSKR